MSRKIVTYVVVTSLCVFFVVAGCEPAAEEVGKEAVEKVQPGRAVVLQLGFNKGDKTRYKLVMNVERGYRMEESSPEKITDERNKNNLEMVFTQKITSVDEQGSALAKIKIEKVKYLNQVKNAVKIDFNSSRDTDAKLAKLVGQTYRIKISPQGNVEVLDGKGPRDAVKSGFEGQVVKALFSDESLAKLHSIQTLPDKDKSTLRAGDSWSRLKAGPRGMLEPKSYEKTYTLESIDQCNGKEVAMVMMNAFPSTQAAEDMPEGQQSLGVFAKMFDSSDTYEGELVLNLDSGKAAKYYEKLEAKWVASDTSMGTGGEEEEPDVLTMSFTLLHSIEMID